MNHLIFDTETTNLIHNSIQPLHKQPRVIEFFGLLIDDDGMEELDTLHAYLNPGVPLSAEVTKITGIKNEQLVGKPPFAEFAPLLVDLMGRADVVVAHNLSYDMAVINFEFARLGKRLVWPERRVCTVEATESLRGYRLNLTALHTELFGEAFAKAHSAEHDVRATARCYVELKARGEV